MAINEPGGFDPEPTRGTGPDKVTELATPQEQSGQGAGAEPEAAGGGLFKLGWGCLPVVAGLLILPVGLFF